MKKFINIFSTVFVAIVIVLLALVTTVKHFGITPYEYKDGAVIYVMAVDVHTLKNGDKVTYKLNSGDEVATNTIQSVDTEKGLFYVKNTELSFGEEVSSDELVPFDIGSVIGKTLFTVPLLGYAVEYISTKTGFTVLLAVVAFFIITAFITAAPTVKAKHSDKEDK